MTLERNPFVPFKPQRGCGLGEGCQCHNAHLASACTYRDQAAAMRSKSRSNMLVFSLVLGSCFAAAGICALLWLEQMK